MTSELEAQMLAAAQNPAALITRFLDWKSGGPDDHYQFGRDALGIDSKSLRHVHMVPLNDPSAWQAWDRAWRQYSTRKSDRYLFYADGGLREGFLLIAVIDDPGAHAIWKQTATVRRFEQVAEDFCVFGKVP